MADRIRIRFDCVVFEVAVNDKKSLSVSAEIESLIDSDGLLAAIVKHSGVDHVRKILEIETRYLQDYIVEQVESQTKNES